VSTAGGLPLTVVVHQVLARNVPHSLTHGELAESLGVGVSRVRMAMYRLSSQQMARPVNRSGVRAWTVNA
jgi:DNA-binding GntR family transcriptional regulator